MTSDTSWRWNGDDWEHRCPGMHPQAGHMRADFIPSPKLKFLKFNHPDMPGWLITEPNETRENVRENFLESESSLDEFTVEEVEMTKEEFDALPEFEG